MTDNEIIKGLEFCSTNDWEDARFLATVAADDAVEEFAERQKSIAYTSTDWSHGEHPQVIEVEDIAELVREMTEEEEK